MAHAPEPMHERLSSDRRLQNFARLFRDGPRAMDELAAFEPQMLSLFTTLPSVKIVVWGHNHKENALVDHKVGKGPVAHYNTGSWTEVNGEWRLNVLKIRTDGEGAVTAELHRTNDQGELIEHDVSRSDKPTPPGWRGLAGRDP